jgi:uncharacterized protein involved in response to NO
MMRNIVGQTKSAFDVSEIMNHEKLLLVSLSKGIIGDLNSNLLGLILVAKNLLISESYYQYGITMTVGLFRLAFVVMFERTIPQFMKNTEGQDLYRNKILDVSIKVSVLISVFQSFFHPIVASGILMIAGSLLFLRWILWRPDIGFKKFGNAMMYAGYFGLVMHFIFAVLQVSEIWSVGTIALHIFTLLCLGIVIPSMLVRISQGHTGRKPQFFVSDKMAISFIFISAFFRFCESWIPSLCPSTFNSSIRRRSFSIPFSISLSVKFFGETPNCSILFFAISCFL